MNVIRSKRMARWLIPLVAFFAVAGHAAADENVWTAELEVEKEMEIYTVTIVAENEADCLAQMSMYRGAVVVEPCQPVLDRSEITDPNDASRGRKLEKGEKPKRP